MKRPRLSTVFKNIEMLDPEERVAVAKYALSLNEDPDRQKLLQEVEDQADADYQALVSNAPDALEHTIPAQPLPSLRELFYQLVAKSNGRTCRQAMINNLQELRTDLSRSTIEKFVDAEARRLGIPKAGKFTIWNIPVKKQMELAI